MHQFFLKHVQLKTHFDVFCPVSTTTKDPDFLPLDCPLQARQVHACHSFPPCPSPPATWERAPTQVATTNLIGCPRQQPSRVFQWAVPPLRITSAAVSCVRPPPHQSHCTARPRNSPTAHPAGGACGPAIPSSWWVQPWQKKVFLLFFLVYEGVILVLVLPVAGHAMWTQ